MEVRILEERIGEEEARESRRGAKECMMTGAIRWRGRRGFGGRQAASSGGVGMNKVPMKVCQCKVTRAAATPRTTREREKE